MLIENSRQNFICFRRVDFNKWVWIFSHHSTLDHKRLGTLW